MIDMGASTDIIDENTFKQITKKGDVQLTSPTKRIFAYGSDSQLAVLGQFTADICFGNKHVQSMTHVIKGNHGSLLSYKTAHNLSLVDVKINHVHSQPQTSDELMLQYPTLFQGIDKLKDAEVRIHIDDTVTP